MDLIIGEVNYNIQNCIFSIIVLRINKNNYFNYKDNETVKLLNYDFHKDKIKKQSIIELEVVKIDEFNVIHSNIITVN